MKSKTRFWSYLTKFFSEREVLHTKVVEKIKTHILFSIKFFQKSSPSRGNVEKHCKTGQATDQNMAHAHFMLDN
jgi:hypothetical protein